MGATGAALGHLGHARIGDLAFLLLLQSVLLANLLLDLLEGFKEELLHFRSLIQDDLREGTDVAQLLILNSQILSRIDDLFSLILDDGLVLVADHLLFFFEIGDDLRQTLL